MQKYFYPIILLFVLFPFILEGASLIDINSASFEELQKIIGIGPVLSQRIIEGRPYNSLDDLIKVKGIGEKTLQKIKEQGLAYVDNNFKKETKKENQINSENFSSNIISNTNLTTPIATPIATPTISTTLAPSLTSEISENYVSGIVFSEILPSPEGSDVDEEWIEIFNQNNFEVNLSGWKIKDIEGKTTTYIFPQNTKISANDFLVLKRKDTKITLNNNKDGLILFSPNGSKIDEVYYEKAVTGKSYNKINGKWVWSSNLTPGKENIIDEKERSQKEENNKENNKKDLDNFLNQSANISENFSDYLNFSFIFLIALIVAIFSGIIILIFKKFFL